MSSKHLEQGPNPFYNKMACETQSRRRSDSVSAAYICQLSWRIHTDTTGAASEHVVDLDRSLFVPMIICERYLRKPSCANLPAQLV
jgi:hypothetical protein